MAKLGDCFHREDNGFFGVIAKNKGKDKVEIWRCFPSNNNFDIFDINKTISLSECKLLHTLTAKELKNFDKAKFFLLRNQLLKENNI